jgi:hypothetical protein
MATQNKQIQIIELGETPYEKALNIQEDLFNKVIAVKRANRQNEVHQGNKKLFVMGGTRSGIYAWKEWQARTFVTRRKAIEGKRD